MDDPAVSFVRHMLGDRLVTGGVDALLREGDRVLGLQPIDHGRLLDLTPPTRDRIAEGLLA